MTNVIPEQGPVIFRPSLIIFVSPSIIVTFAICTFIWAWIAGHNLIGTILNVTAVRGSPETSYLLANVLHLFIRIASAGLLIGSLLMFISRLIVYQTSQLQISANQVLWRTGFIQRSVVSLFMSEIIGAQFHQSITGRLLNFGNIDISSRGDDNIVARQLGNVPEAVNLIMSQKSKL